MKNNPGPATRKPVRSRRAAGAGLRWPCPVPATVAAPPRALFRPEMLPRQHRRLDVRKAVLGNSTPVPATGRCALPPALRWHEAFTAAQGEQGRTSRWSDHCLKCAESPIFFRVSKKFGPRTRRTGGESLSSPSARWQRMSPDRPANFTRQVL